MMHPESFEGVVKLTLLGLTNCYANIKNRPICFEDFSKDILSVVGGADDKSVDDPYEIVMQFISEADKKKGRDYLSSNPYSALLVASTYLMRSILSYEKNIGLGWSYMADARYWYGVVKHTEGIEKAYSETVTNTRRDTASKGAKARSEKYAPLKERAQNLARNLRPINGGWKSRNHAVQSIKKQVLQSAEEMNVSLSSAQADVTLRKWLAEMSDAIDFFPVKNKYK